MSWLSQYAADLHELENLVYSRAPAALWKQIGAEAESPEIRQFLDLMSKLARSNGEPAVLEQVVRIWWERYGTEELSAMKKEAAMQIKLAPVYSRLLSSGTTEEWHEFALMQWRARLSSPPFLALLKRTAPE